MTCYDVLCNRITNCTGDASAGLWQIRIIIPNILSRQAFPFPVLKGFSCLLQSHAVLHQTTHRRSFYRKENGFNHSFLMVNCRIMGEADFLSY